MKNKVKILESIEKEIMDTNKELEYNKTLQLKYPGKNGLKVNQHTLEYVHNQLLTKRENIIKNLELETVEIVLETEHHSIPSRVLGRFLDSFQEVIIGIVRSIQEGKDATGRPTNKIIDLATYEVTTFSPGSFNVSLLSKASHAEQVTFGQTNAKDAIDQLNNLIECKDNIKLLKEKQDKLGTPAIQRYKNFMYTVYTNKASFTMYDFKDNENIRSAHITTKLAKQIHDIIEKTSEETPDDLSFYGELVAVDVDKYEFGFIIHDGDKEERIDGEFEKGIKKIVKGKLEQLCTPKFKRYKTYNEFSDDFKYTWELVGFEEK
ncbi:MAG: hypothetical protein ACPK7O_03540 [Methanobacterium sp.]